MWEPSLVPFSLDDGLAAVRVIAETAKWPPRGLAEVLPTLRAERRARLAREASSTAPQIEFDADAALAAGLSPADDLAGWIRPECDPDEAVTLAEWLAATASPEQRRSLMRSSSALRGKYGVDLAGEDSAPVGASEDEP